MEFTSKKNIIVFKLPSFTQERQDCRQDSIVLYSIIIDNQTKGFILYIGLSFYLIKYLMCVFKGRKKTHGQFKVSYMHTCVFLSFVIILKPMFERMRP